MRFNRSKFFSAVLVILLGAGATVAMASDSAVARTAVAADNTARVGTETAGTATATVSTQTDTVPDTTASLTTFEQDMFNNMLRGFNRALTEGMQRANPANKAEQPVHLSAFSYSDTDARAAVLEKFPVGTTAAQVLRELPQHLVLFEIRFDEHNGIRIKTEGQSDQNVGTRSIILTVDKYFPAGIAPVIQYRIAYLAFNLEGELLDVRVITEIDAP